MKTSTELGENFLSHHGVLGMHWGRHLAGRTEASHNPKPKKRTEVNQEHAEVHTLSKQPISTLSTAELKKVNSRLQAEKQYKDLNPTTVKKGHNALKTIVAIGGTLTALAALSSTPAGKATVKVGKSALGKVLAGNGKHVLVTAAVSTAKHL